MSLQHSQCSSRTFSRRQIYSRCHRHAAIVAQAGKQDAAVVYLHDPHQCSCIDNDVLSCKLQQASTLSPHVKRV
jgi:hypothetical protein